MNRRAKGQRNERRAHAQLAAEGYTVFRLHQPRHQPQGPVDLIAVNTETVKFVQVRTNSWHDLRPLKALGVPKNAEKEAWLFRDGSETPRRRVI